MSQQRLQTAVTVPRLHTKCQNWQQHSSFCAEYRVYFLGLINYMFSLWLFVYSLYFFFPLVFMESEQVKKVSNNLRSSKVPEVLVRIRHLPSSGSSGDSWHAHLREEQMHSDVFLKCLLVWHNIFIFLFVENKIVFKTDIQSENAFLYS